MLILSSLHVGWGNALKAAVFHGPNKPLTVEDGSGP